MSLDPDVFGPAMKCNHGRQAVLPAEALGSRCYHVEGTTNIAAIVDREFVATQCPVKIDWAPGFDSNSGCTEVTSRPIRLGDEFRINRWENKYSGTEYQLVYRPLSGKTPPAIPLDPEIDAAGNLLGFWGSDTEREYRVFLEYLKAGADDTGLVKRWRIQVFNRGDTCASRYRVSGKDVPDVDCPRQAWNPSVPGQGSEGGGSEPPPK